MTNNMSAQHTAANTDGIPMPWRMRGHALERSWSGAQGASNARGRCECGWYYQGWTSLMSSVVMAHRAHMRRAKATGSAT